MPKNSKRKKSSKLPKGFVNLSFYGIWDKENQELVFISLDQDSIEMEYELEGYDDDRFATCYLPVVIDIKNLEQ